MEPRDIEALTARIGRSHLRQRLGLEGDHEVFVLNRPGAHFFYPENWYSVHGVIRHCLRLSGLYERAQRNARAIRLRHNRVVLSGLPDAFRGFRILHLSDLHLDMDPRNADAIGASVRDLDYDLCVLTGDYRAKTFGPFEAVLRAMAALRRNLKAPIYAILGNHDTLRLVPGLESMGIRVLLNETVLIERDGQALYLAGIDDAHYYRVHNIDKVAAKIPEDAVSILLSHTPEIYRHAAHSGFDLLLCGHTHGGQICLPGGFPLTWDARCPRRLAAGSWRHGNLIGYTSVGAGTSVVNARLNCPPEITLHELQTGELPQATGNRGQ
ncbi:metallophosphoesterase [Thiocystis violascens]|uniref:Putative phosphohydrolase n=1 Tax=Thiocystis violascens (strain ATCC 17096 / DSM 198 / 6111) TaxID=765911 RepID=I3Y5M8_THIV6|nr:metallophosphoesterase [Thiocystis violascens]AFL72296.1 putative phosphohydrolase [Thiocystis violascens DSM 198]